LDVLEALDEGFMTALYGVDGVFSWLESAEHRCLLLLYLRIRDSATRWYGEPARAYFAVRRESLDAMLECPDGIHAIAAFLFEETSKVQDALFAMPEKGRFAPELFFASSSACDASAGAGGCVELD